MYSSDKLLSFYRTSNFLPPSDYYKYLVDFFVEAFSARSGGINVYTNKNNRAFVHSTGTKQEDIKLYFERYQKDDPLSTPLLISKYSRNLIFNRSLDQVKNEYIKNPEFRDYLLYNGMIYTVLLLLHFDQDRYAVISLWRDSDDIGFSPYEIDQMNSIVPHIIGSMYTNSLLTQLNSNIAVFNSMHSQDCLLFFDRSGKVHSCNDQAKRLIKEIAPGSSPSKFVEKTLLDVDLKSDSKFKIFDPEQNSYTINIFCSSGHEPIYSMTISGDTQTKTLNSSLLDLLTNKERKITKLLAKGCSNKEIASVLYISENTVKAHLKNIYNKVGAKSRIDLLHKAFHDIQNDRHMFTL